MNVNTFDMNHPSTMHEYISIVYENTNKLSYTNYLYIKQNNNKQNVELLNLQTFAYLDQRITCLCRHNFFCS